MTTTTAEEPGGNTKPTPATAKTKQALHPKPRRQGYSPMSGAAWEAHTTYLRAALAKLKDPSLPEPDPEPLTIDPRSPFTAAWIGAEPGTNHCVVYFTLKNEQRGPRWCPPEVFVLISLLLAFGGGMSVNDNGKGLAYVRLWGGNERFMLGRAALDAMPGQVVKQDPKADHHDQHPGNFRVTATVPISGSPTGKAPRTTRDHALQTAFGKFEKNGWRAEMKVSGEVYEGVLLDAYRLVDAYFGADVA